jgi:hypothetical protein
MDQASLGVGGHTRACACEGMTIAGSSFFNLIALYVWLLSSPRAHACEVLSYFDPHQLLYAVNSQLLPSSTPVPYSLLPPDASLLNEQY